MNESIIQYTNKIEHLVSELCAVGHPATILGKNRALLPGLREQYSVIEQVIRATGKDSNERMTELIILEGSVDEELGD